MNLFFRGALIVAILFYCFFIVRFFTIGNVTVSDQDEGPYYFSSKVFSDYNSLKASVCFHENVSKISESDWYGPGYALVFGTFRKLSLGSDRSFILANLIFILLVIVLVSKQFNIPQENKIWLLGVFLLNPAILNLTFYFMPIILDLLFATVLLVFIQRIYNAHCEKKTVVKLSSFYILCVLLISLFKQNFIFFSFAILPFSKNKQHFIYYLFLTSIAFFLTILYGSFFCAPAYAQSIKSVSYLTQLDFVNFFDSLIHRIYKNLLYVAYGGGKEIPLVYIPVYYFNFLVPVAAIIFALKSKNKLLLSISLATFITLLAYLAFYYLRWYYFVRITTPLLVLNLYALLLMPEQITKWVKPGLILLFLLMLPATYIYVSQNQDAKKENYEKAITLKKEFNKIIPYTKGKEISTILIDTSFYRPFGLIPFGTALPLGNEEGKRIRYTYNYTKTDKYSLFHKLKVDFVLTNLPVQLPYPADLIEHNEYFCLYRINY